MGKTQQYPALVTIGVEPPRQRPIDLVHLAKQTLGDAGLECEVLRMFDAFARSVFLKLERSTTEGELLAHLHSLRGAAAGVGAWGIVDMAEGARSEIANGIVNPERIEDIQMAVEEVSVFIAGLLANEPA